MCPCSSAAGGGGDDDVGGSTAAAALGDSAKGKESGSHGGKTNQSNMYILRAMEGVVTLAGGSGGTRARGIRDFRGDAGIRGGDT